MIEEAGHFFNRIGTPSVRTDNGKADVWVDPSKATIYYQEQSFTTSKDSYKNLIYRIHFEKVPFGLFPVHLTTGKNPGLLVIITLDKSGNPLLVTTAHTCGCYLAITPTSYLAPEYYPNNRDSDEQNIFGERLPGVLNLADRHKQPVCFLFKIRSRTHRVMDIEAINSEEIKALPGALKIDTQPMKNLHSLSVGRDSISFYETEGIRKGYVKNSRKPFEMLLMSWWALDPFVGEDKELGPAEIVGTTFYTSLKFWRRDDSDLWNFPQFLKFWGWKL